MSNLLKFINRNALPPFLFTKKKTFFRGSPKLIIILNYNIYILKKYLFFDTRKMNGHFFCYKQW